VFIVSSSPIFQNQTEFTVFAGYTCRPCFSTILAAARGALQAMVAVTFNTGSHNQNTMANTSLQFPTDDRQKQRRNGTNGTL
jgi:hypothetical protein